MNSSAIPCAPVIAADALAERLGDSGWRIVDCRHRLLEPEAGERLYTSGHIPGARHAHLDRDLARRPRSHEGRHPLPGPSAFARTLERLGIANDTPVVAYDDCGGAMAARFWWMLRWIGHEAAAVLDGGIQAWAARGYALEAGAPACIPARYTLASVHEDWVVKTTAVARELRADAVLIDARSADRFAGRSEPIDPVAGHVPGAVNLPFEQLLNPDGTFAEPRELRAQFERILGGRPAGDVVAMCGSGVTACHILLGMAVAGLDAGRLYAGSWSEWIRDSARSVATGA